MTPRDWRRVLRMSPREIADRASMTVRQHADRWSWQLRRPGWRRADLVPELDASIPAVQQAGQRLADGDDAGAHLVLSGHFAGRPPRFVLAPPARESVARLIRSRFPAATADARRRADRALDGTLDVLGYQDVRYAAGAEPGRIDWLRDPVHGRRAPVQHWSRVPFLDPAIGDHKVIWELNRHQHWLALGRAYCLTRDARYRAGFIAQLDSWMTANPPRTGVNWASMLELALRSLSWIWALHLFVESVDDEEARHAEGRVETAWTVDLLLGLHAQMSLVERHLSTYFSPNTHLLGEALALYVAGRSLPELRASGRWARTGRAVLVAEIPRQIHADGGHAELSAHYHRYTLDFYLLALAVARLTSDAEAIPHFERAVIRLADFAHTLSDRRLYLPQLGDDDGGQLLPICGSDARDAGPSLAIAAALLARPALSDGRPHEEVVWFTGTAPAAARVTDRRTSAWLPESGYVVARTWRGDHLVMDVGPLGYLNAGHAHADALSVTLAVAGRPLLIDPGTGCYTIDLSLRNRLRSTSSHNTVTLDGRSQSEPAGPFHWRSHARATLTVSQLTSRFDYVEASHDGYGPDGHCRQVLARAGCWLFVDWVGGTQARHAAAHWHLDPAWRVQAEGNRVGLQHASGARVWMLSLGAAFEVFNGASNGLGWHAPAYGALRPTTTLRMAASTATPFAMVTAVVESDDPPTLEAIGEWGWTGPSPDPLAFGLDAGSWRETVVAAGPSSAAADGTPYGIDGRGRFLCARTSAAGPAETWVAQAGQERDRRTASPGPALSDRIPRRASVSVG